MIFSTFSHANSGGYIGGGVSPDILSNMVNLIFNDAKVSGVSVAELKDSQAALIRGYEHSRQFIDEICGKNNRFDASVQVYKKKSDEINEKLFFRKMSDAQIWEFAKEQAEDNVLSELWKKFKKNPKKWELLTQAERNMRIKAIVFDLRPREMTENELRELAVAFVEEECGEKWDSFTPTQIERAERILIIIKSRNNVALHSSSLYTTEQLEKDLRSSNAEISRLQIAGGNKTEIIMNMLAVSPDAVSYIYRKEIDRIGHLFQFAKMTTNRDDLLQKYKLYGVISEQAYALALQKAKVSRGFLQIAKEESNANFAKSQAMLNVFNSIYIRGFAYNNRAISQDKGVSYNSDVYVFQRLGEVVDLTQGVSKNNMGALINSVAILEAQATKMVLGELYREFELGGEGMSLEHLGNPSEQAKLNARRKKMQAEGNLNSDGRDMISWLRWSMYLDLLELSMACDKIVQQAMYNNIKNKEIAEEVFNQKIRNVLGNAVNAQGSIYYNF